MDKPALRKQFRAYRQDLTPSDYRQLCRKIGAHLIQLNEIAEANVVHAYWPLLSAREVDIRPVLCFLRALGRTIVLPVVDFSTTTPRLTHRIWEAERDLVPNKWGIREPVNGVQLPVDEVDVVIVPAMGLDQAGNRVGFGKGYYDNFLSGLDVSFVCPMFASCVVACIKTASHDVSVDITVTERGVIRHAA